jgi:hypothetical protein
MARLFRLLFVGLVLATGAVGCKKVTTPATVPGPTEGPQRSGSIPKLVPLPP